jgi:hypothetical protein
MQAPVRVDLEVADDEVVRRQLRERRAGDGDDPPELTRWCVGVAVVAKGTLLLAGQEGGEGALELVEHPVRDDPVAHRPLEGDARDHAPYEEPEADQEHEADGGEDETEPPHAQTSR